MSTFLSSVRVYTNASIFTIPVHCYDGKLQVGQAIIIYIYTIHIISINMFKKIKVTCDILRSQRLHRDGSLKCQRLLHLRCRKY